VTCAYPLFLDWRSLLSALAVRVPTLRSDLASPGTTTRVSEAEISGFGKDVSAPLELNFAIDGAIEQRPWILLGRAVHRNGLTEVHWNRGDLIQPHVPKTEVETVF
jgi:hypothetical protein